jgi:hypothetical protein
MTAEKLFESLSEAFAAEPAVSHGRMFGSPGLKIGGKVFAMLVRGLLVVKLPRERVDTLIRAGQGVRFDPGHGRLMKEWVAVAPGPRRTWLGLARDAKTFVASGR